MSIVDKNVIRQRQSFLTSRLRRTELCEYLQAEAHIAVRGGPALPPKSGVHVIPSRWARVWLH